MPRILAIDYGAKRTGIAVTDPLKLIASPLETVPTHQLETFLTGYFDREPVEAVIVGMPVDTQGKDTHATPLVRTFVNRFKKVFPEMKLALHDERFTSKIAFDAMIEGGVKKKQRRDKSKIDQVSATLILQSYLQSIS